MTPRAHPPHALAEAFGAAWNSLDPTDRTRLEQAGQRLDDARLTLAAHGDARADAEFVSAMACYNDVVKELRL